MDDYVGGDFASDDFKGFDVDSLSEIVYNVDIVMCIDGTGSMAPIIEEVKTNALKFRSDFEHELEIADKKVDQLRIKVIVFRDFGCDSSNAMIESRFFDLPGDEDEYSSFVKNIKEMGGGDTPEHGLEALALAMRSNWTSGSGKQRHVVLLFTDAPAKALGNPVGEAYPEGMPKSLPELHEWWNGDTQAGTLRKDARRMVLFAPNADPWDKIADWDLVNHTQSTVGCSGTDMEEVMKMLVKSVGSTAFQ